MAYAYSTAAWTAAHTALLNLIASGAGTPTVRIYDMGLVKLAEATIDTAASFVNDENGLLTIAIDEQETASPAAGTASEAWICDGDGDAVLKMPCQVGTTGVYGYCIMNTLSILSGAPVDILQMSIQAGEAF